VTIPIRNLYYLFCYAWEKYPMGGSTEVGIDECPDIPNLMARILVNGCNRILRRGLDRGYVGLREETSSPRGRLLIDRTLKEQSLLRGKVYCEIDELRSDVLHNQILKATAVSLASTAALAPTLAHQLRMLVRKLEDITDIRLTPAMFRRVQLFRNNVQYSSLIRLCEFTFRSQLPDESGKGTRFSDILRDEVTMSSVFEDFLRNFYHYEQGIFGVGREDMRWRFDALPGGSSSLIPIMKTDVTLRSTQRTIVIDAKFYAEPFTLSLGTPKIRSAHLYQMYAYIRHAGELGGATATEGILVYASTGVGQRHEYRIDGHRVSVVAVDLRQPWQHIRDTLLDLVADQSPSSTTSSPAVSAYAS
jgi:5-methylcytosine-specific restriction enzyme subunit McrC